MVIDSRRARCRGRLIRAIEVRTTTSNRAATQNGPDSRACSHIDKARLPECARATCAETLPGH